VSERERGNSVALLIFWPWQCLPFHSLSGQGSTVGGCSGIRLSRHWIFCLNSMRIFVRKRKERTNPSRTATVLPFLPNISLFVSFFYPVIHNNLTIFSPPNALYCRMPSDDSVVVFSASKAHLSMILRQCRQTVLNAHDDVKWVEWVGEFGREWRDVHHLW